ncbi:MAG TPA: hypothetical protein VGO93_15725 [Candidatus Xenobia bacterium]
MPATMTHLAAGRAKFHRERGGLQNPQANGLEVPTCGSAASHYPMRL